MATRICDVCGKKKDLSGGKTCEKSHFVCSGCKSAGPWSLAYDKTQCPICKKPLR